jgi:hypothetical protein
MRRSGCYGTCPVYSVEILSDGRVTFDGEDYVQSKGKHQGKITAADLALLTSAFDRVDFAHLQDRYVSSTDGCLQVWTDHPTVEIVLTAKGQKKGVVYYYGCEGLAVTHRVAWLSETIDEVARIHQWTDAVPGDVMTWLKDYAASQRTFDGKTTQYPDMPTIVEGQLNGAAAAALLFDFDNITGGGNSLQYLALFWKRGDHYVFCCSHRVGGTRMGAVKAVTFSGDKLHVSGNFYVPGKDAECCPSKPYVTDLAVAGSTLVDAPRAPESGAAAPLSDRDVAVLGVAFTHFRARSDTWPARPNGYVAVNPDTETLRTGAAPDAFLEELHKIREKVPSDAVGDFIRRNRSRSSIPTTITKAAPVRIQSEEQAGGWPIGMNNHEIGSFVTAFSPGYSADGTAALVRFSFNWSIHGATATYVLRLKQGVWSVEASELTIYL